MKKTIKARIYINKVYDEAKGKLICNKIDKDIEGWPIDYSAYMAELLDKEVMVFDIYIEAKTFKDCDIFYSYIKRSIKDNTYESTHQLFKIQGERI